MMMQARDIRKVVTLIYLENKNEQSKIIYNDGKWSNGRGSSYSKLSCRTGTFRSSKVKMVTNPNDAAANHSGTAENF